MTTNFIYWSAIGYVVLVLAGSLFLCSWLGRKEKNKDRCPDFVPKDWLKPIRPSPMDYETKGGSHETKPRFLPGERS
jgi:hypothetical protein